MENRGTISPDGSMVSFIRREQDKVNLYVMDLVQRRPKRLVEGVGNMFDWMKSARSIYRSSTTARPMWGGRQSKPPRIKSNHSGSPAWASTMPGVADLLRQSVYSRLAGYEDLMAGSRKLMEEPLGGNHRWRQPQKPSRLTSRN